MKKKRVTRRGSQYAIEIRWREKPVKNRGFVLPPGQAMALEVGTAAVTIMNHGTFTYAHVRVRVLKKQ